jgi:hypothetical protein
MRLETIIAFKKQIRDFYHLFGKIVDYYGNQPHHVMIKILIQNVSLDTSKTCNYNIESDITLINNIDNLLTDFYNYYEDPISEWAGNEYHNLLLLHQYMDDMNNE